MGRAASINAVKQGGGGWQQDTHLKPLISVVTVVRNGERYLDQTIKSVVEQTYKNLELLVVDGNSTDGTLDVIRKYERSVACWISEPDEGIYDAMNKAIRLCKGEYLHFLNCADYFTNPDTLGEVARYLSQNKPDILSGYVLYRYEDGLRVYSTDINSEYKLYRDTVCHQALFTARGLFDTVGIFDKSYRISADREWLLRALKVHNYKLVHLDMPICICEGSGVSSRQRMRLRLENVKMNYKYFKWRFYPFLVKQLGNKIRRLAISSR